MAVLLGEPSRDPDAAGHPSVASIRRAMVAVPGDPDGEIDVPGLRQRVDSLWVVWQGPNRNYTRTGEVLPGMIRDAEIYTHALTDPADEARRREAHRIAADVYCLTRAFVKQVGRLELAAFAADRARRAAEAADDPLRVATARWNLGHALLADSAAEEAEEVVNAAAEAVMRLPESRERQAMFGALNLVSMMAAIRQGDYADATKRWELADQMARQTGETNVEYTVFGPANVALHAVSLHAESGDTTQALSLAERVPVTDLASAERRTTFHLELARCYEDSDNDQGVLGELLRAERESPEDLRYRPAPHALIRALHNRARPSYIQDVLDLAQRCQVYEAQTGAGQRG